MSSRLNRALLPIGVGICLLLGGVWLLIQGAELGIGLDVTALGLAITCALSSPLLRRRGRGEARRAMVTYYGSCEPALVFHYSVSAYRLLFVSALLFTLAGIGVLRGDFSDPGISWDQLRVAGLLALVAFGLGSLALLVPSLAGAGEVDLLTSGILSRTPLQSSFVPWSAIQDAFVSRQFGNPLLGVRLRPGHSVERQGLWLLQPMSRAVCGADLAYPLDLLVEAPDDFVRAVQDRVGM